MITPHVQALFDAGRAVVCCYEDDIACVTDCSCDRFQRWMDTTKRWAAAVVEARRTEGQLKLLRDLPLPSSTEATLIEALELLIAVEFHTEWASPSHRARRALDALWRRLDPDGTIRRTNRPSNEDTE